MNKEFIDKLKILIKEYEEKDEDVNPMSCYKFVKTDHGNIHTVDVPKLIKALPDTKHFIVSSHTFATYNRYLTDKELEDFDDPRLNNFWDTKDELKPCPFCGGKAVIEKDKDYRLYYPRCSSGARRDYDREKIGVCIGNQGWWGFDTREEAIKAWNKRSCK